MTYDDMKAPTVIAGRCTDCGKPTEGPDILLCDTCREPYIETWQSPAGSWKVYAAITDDHARQQALDHLNSAVAKIAYVIAWAELDGPELASLNEAQTNICNALKEFSR